MSELQTLRAELDDAKEQLSADEARQTELRGELQHRVRNMLAVIRSIFERSQTTSNSKEELSDHFRGRLDVIGRYQLGHGSADGGAYDLETIIHDEFLTVHAADDVRIRLKGRHVNLAPLAGLVIGLALHELTTNSIKFGVLSSAGERGRIAIGWSLKGDVFEFEWEENGIPIISSAPMRSGFGRDYLESAVPYQLGGTTQFRLDPGGLACRFSLPAARVLADGEMPSFWVP